MRPTARLAKRAQRLNQMPRDPLTACAGPYEQIIQRTAAAGEDNFGQIKEKREANRFPITEGGHDFRAGIIRDQLQHYLRRSGRGTSEMRRHFLAIG